MKTECFQVGDSLLVVYTDKVQGNLRKQGAWISDNGTVTRVELGLLADLNFREVTRKGNDLFFYFLTMNKDKSIRSFNAYKMNIETNAKTLLNEQFVPVANLNLMFKKKNIYILGLNRDDGSLVITILDGMKVVETRKIELKLPEDFFKARDMELFKSDQMSPSAYGTARLKVTIENDIAYLSLDDKQMTIVFRIDLLDYSFRKFILDQSDTRKNFKTFIVNDIIYKVSSDEFHTLDLDVYDLITLRKINYVRLYYEKLAPFKSYERNGREQKIEKPRFFDPIIGFHQPDWSIIVHNGLSSNSIRIGTWSDEYVNMGSAINPLAFIVLKGILDLDDGKGLSRYTYLTESGNHSSISESDDSLKRSQLQRADEYEYNYRKKLGYKGYGTFKGNLIGVYAGTDNILKVVRFGN